MKWVYRRWPYNPLNGRQQFWHKISWSNNCSKTMIKLKGSCVTRQCVKNYEYEHMCTIHVLSLKYISFKVYTFQILVFTISDPTLVSLPTLVIIPFKINHKVLLEGAVICNFILTTSWVGVNSIIIIQFVIVVFY